MSFARWRLSGRAWLVHSADGSALKCCAGVVAAAVAAPAAQAVQQPVAATPAAPAAAQPATSQVLGCIFFCGYVSGFSCL